LAKARSTRARSTYAHTCNCNERSAPLLAAMMQAFGGSYAVFEDSVESTGVLDSRQDAPKVSEAPEHEDAASLLSLRLAREKLTSEKVFNLLCYTMQEPEIALLIGQAAGIPAVFHYGASARDHGRAMRETLPVLYANSLPNVYICGGASIFRGVLDSVSRFDTSENTWETMAPMPTARRLCAAATVAGTLYVLGGEYEEPPLWYTDSTWRQYRQLKTAECFDPFTASWRTIQDMPTARAGCSAAAIGGMLYVCGGRIVENVRAAAERFDTATGRWERLPDMPTARSGCSAVALLGMLYVIGGKGCDGQILATVERFDPSIGWWQVLPPMPMPRSASASGAIGGKIYVAGGFNGSEGVDGVDSFDPVIGQWETQEPMQTWRIGAATAIAGGKLYVLGGKTGGDHALMCERFDPTTGAWSWLPPMPERHVYCAGAAVVGYL